MKTVPFPRSSFVAVSIQTRLNPNGQPIWTSHDTTVCPGSKLYCTEALETNLQLEVHGQQTTDP